ncbi:MAG: hypothetical protein ACE5GE_02750 [Phycisphaerae bacterium]
MYSNIQFTSHSRKYFHQDASQTRTQFADRRVIPMLSDLDHA